MSPRAALLALFAATLAMPARGAILRGEIMLDGPDIHLTDLFDEAGPQGMRLLGPAPAPGASIVVEAAQLAAIARQFSVDWRPVTGAERAVLSRAGAPLPREDVVRALRAALPGAGAPNDADIDLMAYAAPMLPAEALAQVGVEQLDYDPASFRFSALIVISAARMAPLHQRVAGRVQEMRLLPVPLRRIAAGERIAAGDLRMERVRASLVHDEAAGTMADAVGMAARHILLPGLPMALADLARPILVHRGATVAMALALPGLSVSAQAEAMENGALGEHIRVRNTASGAMLEAEVTGAEQVRVQPGAAPLRRAANQWAAR